MEVKFDGSKIKSSEKKFKAKNYPIIESNLKNQVFLSTA